MKNTTTTQTPFQIAQQQVKEGTLKTPSVSYGSKNIDYFGYQISVHKFNLSIMASGMSCRGIKLKDLKHYYGLKGKTASDCLVQFNQIIEEYQKSLGIKP